MQEIASGILPSTTIEIFSRDENRRFFYDSENSKANISFQLQLPKISFKNILDEQIKINYYKIAQTH